jgi:hypothetical protein
MYPALKQSSTSSGMHEQSKGCQDIPSMFWDFVSNDLKHTGQTSYPNPQVLFFLPNSMAKTTYVHFHLQSKSRYYLETNLLNESFPQPTHSRLIS